MEPKHTDIESELNDLKHEMEHFQQEKERVRAIIGKIGGVPKFGDKLLNIGFLVIIAGSLTLSVVGSDRLKPIMIELAMVTLSLKIIYLIHCQAKVNHFQFWILSSLEWRINEITKIVKDVHKNNPAYQHKHPEVSEPTNGQEEFPESSYPQVRERQCEADLSASQSTPQD